MIQANDKIRAGLIGAGKMGISHFATLNAHPRVQMAAVCDTSGFVLSFMKKNLGVETYKDYIKMFDEANLDCVLVATPTKMHGQVAREAMKRGLHVFMEKPFVLDVTEGEELVRLAQEKNLVNQVGYHNRFIGTFQEAKRLVDNGTLGEIYHVRGEAYGQVVVKEQGATWRQQKSEGGGCLHDYCSHVVDLMNFIVGAPEHVEGAHLTKIFSADVEDGVFATLSYRNGMSGQLSVNWSDDAYRKMTTRVTIMGKKGKLIVDRQECQLYLRQDAATAEFPAGWTTRYITDLQEPVWFYVRGEEYSSQIDYFVNAVKEKRGDNVNSFASALQTDHVIRKITEADMARS